MHITNVESSTEITWWKFWGEKPIVQTLTLAISRAHLARLPSVIEFALTFMAKGKSKKNEAFPFLLIAVKALRFLELFEPGARIVRCRLDCDDVPDGLTGRISRTQYANVLQPLRTIVVSREFNKRRDNMLLLASDSPIFHAMILEKLGDTLSGPFVLTQLRVRTVLCLDGEKRLFREQVQNPVEKCTQEINREMAWRRVSLINPNETSLGNCDAEPKDLSEIEWVVKPQ